MSHSAKRVPVAVLISGRGSNMTALIEAAHAPDYPAEIRLVISNIPNAPGLETARAAGIQTLTIDHRIFGKNREAHERAIDSALRDAGIEIVCLAGYMRLLTPFLTDAWSGRMLNIHPSLLPEFPGLHTHERAIAAKASKHGCTIHLVTAGMDEGPVLAQAAVDVFPDDTPESLAARVLKEEHQLYPKTLAELIRKNTD
ncbi:MAG: phosphoribosylglycinamide formyltransferase [Acetobacter sp.]|jgi:phosphoribosylglycinamide formyltransferase-1|nr:phosphoribosylglycinamide formyltransferase [Acetobacter sp.]MCH4062580.1 phosphoribosylglycinamide formyltransferase [Acetobacter sp.]MCH4088574.1 phosphoribosylglycinamide formyltransferase [Acetobacter sp.]MCI1294041.1 phosphoribosylglycinamide formyltransferase [Acetobacter sp.]MCI1320568.1 phosphoribosylglycinamide formyltransferase [Acetobacter sp.]